MSHVEGSITINAPALAIQEALNDVEHANKWATHLEKVWDVKGRGAGCSYKWRYSQKGIGFNGETKILESTPGRFIMTTTGGIPSTWTWTMLPLPRGGTELRLSIEYSVPGSIFGKIADRIVIERQNQRDLKDGLSGLKTLLEK
ncbi:SRPBCC family protein [Anaerolineales bacterium HSG6]|nr:SRPBCC family protein [Anaerolineales bacterium HSG6]MDM8531297.1 SRPBCC family protein [Anaerolineales bacterium HSG25]